MKRYWKLIRKDGQEVKVGDILTTFLHEEVEFLGMVEHKIFVRHVNTGAERIYFHQVVECSIELVVEDDT